MEGSSLPQTSSTVSPSSYGCQKSSEQETAGKSKSKTKHTLKKSSKLAEKQASCRHQALEKEFSRAQRQAGLDPDQLAPEVDLPLGPSTSAQGVWSIPGTPVTLGSPSALAQHVTMRQLQSQRPPLPPRLQDSGPDIGDIFSDGCLEALLSKVVDQALAQRSPLQN